MPTHTCFDDALEFMEDLARNYPAALAFEGYKLIHAICLMPDGERYAHAWVEDNAGRAHFFGMIGGEKKRIVKDAKWYRLELRVQEFREYNVHQAWAENKKHGTYGPWVEKYKELCRK